jgi:release factor glutamine methyltransferase
MTIQLAYRQLSAQLYEAYHQHEAANIADMVIEFITGHRKIDRIIYKDLPLTEEQQKTLEKIAAELLKHRPVQYVLGETWFMDMKLMVNEGVLIPRPETEELVEWILNDIKQSRNKKFSLIDIGTGSGCIPIAVKKKIPNAAVSAIDVSDYALEVAKSNAVKQQVQIDIYNLNFLDEAEWKRLGKYDIIVSNPPYIKKSEEVSMRDNVLKYEPHLALFVPDEDSLIFYKAIAKFCQTQSEPEASVYVEINESSGKEVAELFKLYGFNNVIIKKDMQGKDRMVKATL